MNYSIAFASQSDIPEILNLIKQLAVYEKAAQEVTVDEAVLLRDGFGKDKIFDCFVARTEENALLYQVFHLERTLYLPRRHYCGCILSRPRNWKSII